MIDEKTVRRALMTARNVVQSVSSSSSQVTDPHVLNPDRMNRGGTPSMMGINVRNTDVPYADHIVDGKKTYETRDSHSLKPYVGKRVAIVRTGAGPTQAIGEATFGEPKIVGEQEFRSLEPHHLVKQGSAFDIKPNGVKYLYPVIDPVRYDEPKGVGHGIVSRAVHKAEGGEVDDRHSNYVAWFPHQIKSAVGNRGMFDPHEADITMNRGGVPGKNVKEDSPAKRMIDDVYSRYPAHPFYSDQRGIMHGKDQVGIFKLSEHPFNPKSVFIDWLAAHPQRSGIGTKTLDALKEHAAQYGTTLSLSPWDKGTVSKSALKKFYTTKNKFNPVNPNAPLGTLMWSPEDDQKSDPDDITKSGGGDVEPKLRTDNPGGEWLEEQKNLSAKAGNHPSGAPKRFGAVTGNFRENLTLPLSVLSVLKGVSGEQANVRQNDLDWLKNHMQSGKLPPISDDNETEYAPFVTVDQNGRPWVNEGNHRIMAAHELGWRHMPVSVRYFSGGERVDGPFHPDRLLALHRHHVDKPRIAKAESGDDITKSEGGEVDHDYHANLAKFMESAHPEMFDEQGKPKTIYHGTSLNRGLPELGIRNFDGSHIAGWFSETPQRAENYANLWPADEEDQFSGAHLYPAHVSLKNPFVFNKDVSPNDHHLLSKDAIHHLAHAAKAHKTEIENLFSHSGIPEYAWELIESKPFVDFLKRKKFDGIIQHESGHKTFGAFYPHQIKSAIGNRGTFDPHEADITKAEGGEVDDVPHKKFGGDLDDDGVSDFTPPKLRGTQIMKEPGGQWLNGSVEGSMSPLKTKTVATYRGTMETPELAKEIAERGISNIEKHPENSRDTRMMQLNDTLNTANRAKSVNDFVGKQLTRYVKNDMGTEGDPIRALAERGILHYVPHQNGNEHQTQDIEHDADLHRRGRGRASNSLAKQWENNSDLAIDQFEKSKADKDTINENPWLDKLEPHDVVNGLFGHGVHRYLGFDHLIDELHNSVNPESGLPDRLQLRPESLARMSVPQAVQHVHNINEWRENNKAEADAKLAFNPATYLHKDYPGKDYAWYELKPSPNAKPPVPAVYGPGKHAVHGAFPRKFETEEEAHKYIKEFPENIRNANDHGQFDPILKNLHDLPLHYAGQNDEELEPFKPGEDKHLEDALKYEGNCMGHCVGGYHEDVAEGNSRIFSLRHKKTGAPHVTIETSPRALVRSDLVNHLGGNEKLADDYLEKGFKLRQDAWTSGDKHGLTPLGHALRLAGVPKVDDISQIKGKGNAKPTDRYLPYVQDFIQSGNWGRIGDLHNTGLRRMDELYSGLTDRMKEAGEHIPKYMTEEEFHAAQKRHFPHAATGGAIIAKASGGVVDPQKAIRRAMMLAKDDREKNLSKFLEGSESKNVMYHGSGHDIQQFDTARGRVPAIYLSHDPAFASWYANRALNTGDHPTVYPLHVSAKKPFDYENKHHVDKVMERFRQIDPEVNSHMYRQPYKIDPHLRHQFVRNAVQNGEWQEIESPAVQQAIRESGFDGFHVNESGVKNLAVYDPKQVKSAIGNRGTFDTNDADISKASGGIVDQKIHNALSIARSMKGVGGITESPQMEQTFQKENRPGVVVSPNPGQGGGPPIVSEKGFEKTDKYRPAWNFATPNVIGASKPPPVQAPLQNQPRLGKIATATSKIFTTPGYRGLMDQLFEHHGLPKLHGPLSVSPIHGMYEGTTEPSFFIDHPGMTDAHASVLAPLLGFGFQQDSAIRIAHNAEAQNSTPAALIGGDSKLTPKQIEKIAKISTEEGLSGFSQTKDGTGVKFLHFPDEKEQDLEAAHDAFVEKAKRVADRANLPYRHTVKSSSELINAQDYLDRAFGSHAQGSGEARLHAGTERPSHLFRGAVDHVLAPYARAVSGEGFRLSPDRLAETYGLTDEEREHVRGSLYPGSRADQSTVPLMEGKEKLDVRPTGKNGKSNVDDVLFALQNRAAQKGQIDTDDRSTKAKEAIARNIAREVEYHVKNSDKSAIGWYDAALKKAMGKYAEIFPELATDKNKELLFHSILGITSQGNDVYSNSINAARLYSLMRDGSHDLPSATKKLANTFGNQTKAIEGNLHKLHHLLDNNGYDKMRDLFNKTMTASQWNDFLSKNKDFHGPDGKPLSVEGSKDQKVTGWSVFGPKIGSFINNLHGDYSTLTADLWFSRTWNRLLGHNFSHAPEKEAKQYREFRDALRAEHYSNPENMSFEGRRLIPAASGKTQDGKLIREKNGNIEPWEFGKDATKLSDKDFDRIINDPEEMLKYAQELHESYKGGGYKEKSDLRRRAKNWIENRENSVAAPRGDTERSFQQDTVEHAQKMLKKRGLDISVADIQAALWFHEKELFGKLGVASEKAQPADYADAADKAMEAIQKGTLFESQSKAKKYKKEANIPKSHGGLVDHALKMVAHLTKQR